MMDDPNVIFFMAWISGGFFGTPCAPSRPTPRRNPTRINCNSTGLRAVGAPAGDGQGHSGGRATGSRPARVR